MIGVVSLIAGLLALTPASEAAGTFGFRKTITITKSTGGSLTNFPVVVTISGDTDLTANVQSALGYDIVFKASDGVTPLDFEIESFDRAAGDLVAWVKIPTLLSGANTIYMDYGNALITSPPATPCAVWGPDYIGVWHMGETGDGSINEYRDSSPYTNHGQGGEGQTLFVPSRVAGQVGFGQRFDNSDTKYNYIDCGDDALFNVTGTQITLQAWVQHNITPSGSRFLGILNSKGYADGYSLWVDEDASRCNPNPVLCLGFNLPGYSHQLRTNTPVTAGSWHHVVATYDGATMRVYIDGTQDINTLAKTNNISPSMSQQDFWIGQGDQPEDVGWSSEWEGDIDEVRIARVARSADWVATEYANQTSTCDPPTAFCSVGAQAPGPFADSSIAINYRSIGTDTGNLASSGNATSTANSTTVTFDTDLPTNVGQGDQLTLDPGGTPEVLFILSRDSAIQVTVQTPAGSSRTVGFNITRAYNSLAAWESGQGGNLVTGNRREIGVAYNDSTFGDLAGVTIDGSTTDCARYMKLTSPMGQRHQGVAGTGATVDNGSSATPAIQILDDYVNVEWLEIKGGGVTADGIELGSGISASNRATLQYNIIHATGRDGIRLSDPDSIVAIYNNVIYEANNGIHFTVDMATNSRVSLFNNTIYSSNGTSGDPSGIRTAVRQTDIRIDPRNNLVHSNTNGDYGVVKPFDNAYFCNPGCAPIDSDLADRSSNFTLNFTAGDYLYLGLSQKFRGFVMELDIGAAGNPNLQWEYWNGAWSNLESGGFSDYGDSFKWDATLYWPADPTGWVTTTVSGSPALYYVRASLASGSYTTFPREKRMTPAMNIASQNNLASDNTASYHSNFEWGNSGIDNVTLGNVNFEDTTPGSENLHIVRTTTAEDSAIDLSRFFSFDIDGGLRTAPWDIGADEVGLTNGSIEIAVGSYSGNLTAGRQITGVGFQPDLVIVKADLAATNGVMRSSTMSGTKDVWALTAPEGNLITAFDSDGFTIGDDARVNGSGVTYYWTAIKGGADMKCGTYTGDGSAPADTQAITGLGFSPEYVILISDGGNRLARHRTQFGGLNSNRIRNSGALTDTIPSLDADGFTVQVGADTQEEMNTNGMIYHYIAFNEVAGKIKVGQYTGDNSDNRNITGVGFEPEYVLLQSYIDADPTFQKSAAMAGDASVEFNAALTTNRIQALIPDGFQVGNYAGVNASLEEYAYVAFNTQNTTAVSLVGFEATALDGAVVVEWETGSEVNNLGFHLYRALSSGGPYERITSTVIPGLGSSPEGQQYSYTDTGLANGVTYYYKLEDIETTGKTTMHGPVWATPHVVEESGGGKEEETPTNAEYAVGHPERNELNIFESRTGELVLELITEGFYAIPQDNGTVLIEIPDFTVTEDVGMPAVPVRRTWVPVPAGQQVNLASVTPFNEETFDGLTPETAGAPSIEVGRGGTVRATRQRRQRVTHRGETYYPEQSAELLGTAFQEEVKKALVEMAPLRWDTTQNRLVLAHRLVVRLSLEGRDLAEQTTSGRRGRRYPRPQPPPESGRVVTRWVTTETGLYGVDLRRLLRSREGAPINQNALRLSRQGEAVPFHIEGTTLYFVSVGGEGNPYGHEAVYELEVGVSGERMPRDSVTPGGAPTAYYWELIREEEDLIYQAALVQAPDRWLWKMLFAPARESLSFNVSALASSPEPSQLKVWLQGASDFAANPDHHVQVYVNGTLVGETHWNGKEAKELDLEVGAGILREGENVVEVENVDDTEATYSMVMLNRFELSYPRRLEGVNGQLQGRWSHSGTAEVRGVGADAVVLQQTPTGFTWLEGFESTASGVRFQAEAGGSYLVVSQDAVRSVSPRRVSPTSRLKTTSQQADYVVIGPREFLVAVSPLLELRRRQGLKAKAVAIEDVYSEFGFGEENPQALKDFLAYAYHSWEQAPRYIVLAGDGTYDFKDNLGTGVENHVPPMMVLTSYLETASDAAYAAVNGEDLLPDLAIGRLPAATVEELQRMVGKIVAFETSSQTFGGRAVLVSDNPDRAGDFVANAETLATTVLNAQQVEKIYLSQLGPTATRSQIVQAFDDGASLMNYIGHGGIHLWADENIFNNDDVATLALQSKQPLLLTMNCLNGYFHFPYLNALSEELLKADGKGAVAAFSPSGLSVNSAAHIFHRLLLDELVRGAHARLGDAVLAAQSAYANSGALPEMIAIYHLFGDPAMTIQ